MCLYVNKGNQNEIKYKLLVKTFFLAYATVQRSEAVAPRCFIKKIVLEISIIHREKPVSESLF